MYEHILVPTDGSRLSNAAVEKTLAFAKEVGARRYLASAANRAKITGVQCDTLTVWHEHVYQAIIDTAAAKVCDLISMASHGRRRGLTAMVKAGQGQGQRTVGQTLGCDLTTINGRRDQLEGKIQERYGYQKDQVRKDVDDWYNRQTW